MLNYIEAHKDKCEYYIWFKNFDKFENSYFTKALTELFTNKL